MTTKTKFIEEHFAEIDAEQLALLNEVREYLDGTSDKFEGDVNELVRMMLLRVSFRDACIAYVIAPQEVAEEDMRAFALTPHSPQVAKQMSEMLSSRFENGVDADSPTISRMIDLMQDAHEVVGTARGRAVAQAVTAYFLWWKGEGERALPLALDALDEDEDYTLASIVVNAVVRGVKPARG